VQRCGVLGCAMLAFALYAAIVDAQDDPKSQSDRAAARIKALQAESDQLAAQARTVFGELRRLELERAIKQTEVARVETELARVTVARDNASDHVATLEAERIQQTPGIKERLVELSKRGRGGYVQMLLSTDDVRAVGRMARGVAAVAELDRIRLEAHRRTITEERDALKELDGQRDAVARLQRDATEARRAADAAVAARNRMLQDLDLRRDLAAQYVTELQHAQVELDRTIAGAEAASTTASLPIRPFKGDLPWPIAGELTSRFGRMSSGRFGTNIVRNGIEVAAAEGTEAKAVHEGTVAYAAPFAGFGTLVIVDHGSSAFTLYGHLLQATVTAGASVHRGTVVGRVGTAPSGAPALYFEVRIDGRPVDPLQWLARLRH
jgi:murein hydrolase activator